jgi:hypothetical protein
MGAQKKYITLPTPQKKKVDIDPAVNIAQKAEIEKMKKLLSEKIKDPKLAKRAALIITEMLNTKN